MATLQDKINQAKSYGYTDAEINAFIANPNGTTGKSTTVGQANDLITQSGVLPSTPSSSVSGAPPMTPTPTKPMMTPTPTLPPPQNGQLSSIQPREKNLIQKAADVVVDWLPTIGSVAGGIAGTPADVVSGPGGTIAGAAGGAMIGESLKQGLQGNKFSPKDVVVQGAIGGTSEFGGPLIAKGIGKVAAPIGKMLSGIGEKIAGKVNPNVFNSVVSATPNYATKLKDLSKTASDYGLMAGTAIQGVEKLPQVMKGISEKITKALSGVTVPVPVQKVVSNFESIIKNNSNYGEGVDGAYTKAKDFAIKRIESALGGGSSGILDAAGKPIASNSTTLVSNIYKLKAEVGQELSNAFKKLERGGVLSPQEETDMGMWNSLKNTIDEVAPVVKPLNDAQNHLYDIAQGLVKEANKAKKGSPLVDMGDMFQALGANAIFGPGAAAGLYAADKIAETGAGKKVIGGAFDKAGEVLQGGVPKGVKNLIGQSILQPLNQQINPDTNPQDSNNHTSSLPDNIVKDNFTGKYSRTLIPELQEGGVGYSVDEKGNYKIPDQLEPNVIPQDYTYDQYKQDRATMGRDPQAAEYIDKIYDASTKRAEKYLDQHALQGDERKLMDNAPVLNEHMNRMWEMLQQVPPNVFNRIHTIDELNKYENGKYAALGSAMKTLNGQISQETQGGVVRGFDLAKLLSSPASQGESLEQALSELDEVHKELLLKHKQLLPQYTMVVGGLPKAQNGQLGTIR